MPVQDLPARSVDTAAPSAFSARTPAPGFRRFYLVGEEERSTRAPKTAARGRISIAINGHWHTMRGRTVTFEQLLRLAYPDRVLATPVLATVSYRHGVAAAPAGILIPGDVIEIADGLRVTASATYAS